MWIISFKKLRQFWQRPGNADAETPLSAWYQAVKASSWARFADIRKTYAHADLVGNKVVFNIGGNKYRLIVVIDYEGHKVFVRHVLDHEEYDEEEWKKDTFGSNWKPRTRKTAPEDAGGTKPGSVAGQSRPRRRRGRPRKR